MLITEQQAKITSSVHRTRNMKVTKKMSLMKGKSSDRLLNMLGLSKKHSFL